MATPQTLKTKRRRLFFDIETSPNIGLFWEAGYKKNVKREVSIDYIQKTVSDYFQLDLETLQSKTRKRHVVQARQLAMFFAKKFTKASLANIGSQIGDRDHATVLHACKTVDNLVSTDKQFKKYMEDIHKKLSL